MLRKRPLLGATMFGSATGHPANPDVAYPARAARPEDDLILSASSEGNRIDALTKLKSLFDSGVLTKEQYESEWARLTRGI